LRSIYVAGLQIELQRGGSKGLSVCLFPAGGKPAREQRKKGGGIGSWVVTFIEKEGSSDSLARVCLRWEGGMIEGFRALAKDSIAGLCVKGVICRAVNWQARVPEQHLQSFLEKVPQEEEYFFIPLGKESVCHNTS